MKHINLFIVKLISSIMLLSCVQNNSKTAATTSDSLIKEENTADTLDDKFLISNNAVGMFKLGESWQEIAQNNYQYQNIQGYGSCVDACCDGGYLLGERGPDDEYGPSLTRHEISIGSEQFDDNDDKDKHKANSDVFYSSSDNCQSWYWKDKINYIVVFGKDFKTKEGIGVGSTLKELQETYKKIAFQAGWIEEDPNALKVTVDAYPKLSFVLDIENYKGDWKDLSLKQDDNTLSIADFKENTKIEVIIVR